MLSIRIAVTIALLVGALVANEWARVAFLAALVAFGWALARDIRADRRGTPTLLEPDEPVGPWLAATAACLGVCAISWNAFRPPTNDEPVYALTFALCWGAGLVAGWLVRAAIQFLPRYRVKLVSPSRREPRG